MRINKIVPPVPSTVGSGSIIRKGIMILNLISNKGTERPIITTRLLSITINTNY